MWETEEQERGREKELAGELSAESLSPLSLKGHKDHRGVSPFFGLARSGAPRLVFQLREKLWQLLLRG